MANSNRIKRRAWKTHGESYPATKEYKAWDSMLDRCRNPRSPSWEQYGGRGITVCDRWREYANFLKDMGRCPPYHSIDRIDNDSNYEPGNCRWASAQTQAINRRSTHWISYLGETLTKTEWAARVGLKFTTLNERLRRGWGAERALQTPARKRTPPSRS